MKKEKKVLLDIGVVISAGLCIAAAFLVVYHAGRHPVEAMASVPVLSKADGLEAIASKAFTPVIEEKDVAHQEMLADALRKKPDHVPVLLELAQLEAESGNKEKAGDYLREVLQYEPENMEAKLNLGKQMFELGKVEEAIKLNEEILETEPSYADALYNLGAIYGNLGERERALYYWNQLIETAPGSESGIRAKQMMARM